MKSKFRAFYLKKCEKVRVCSIFYAKYPFGSRTGGVKMDFFTEEWAICGTHSCTVIRGVMMALL